MSGRNEVRDAGVNKEYFSTPHGSVLLPETTQLCQVWLNILWARGSVAHM